MHFLPRFVITLSLLFFCVPAQANGRATPSLMGALGLNTVPTARMDESGTARFLLSTLDPYLHTGASFQIARPLNITVRQSAEVSDVNGNADRLFPGVDLRLRLAKEGTWRPEITLGLQSAIGHRRMAGEYVSLTKRYEDFDFTAGMAWGRLGSAAHVNNPLKGLHKHFGKDRMLDGEEPNNPNNWFTGEDVGFFAGVEYFSPHIEGLSLKADWGADRYIVERSLSDFNPPDPWAIGISYAPVPWADTGIALVGGEKLMGRISLHAPLQKWFGRSHKKTPPHHMRAYRTGMELPSEMALAAERENINLYDPRIDGYAASTLLLLDPNQPLPLQLGRAARHMHNHAGEYVEELRITPLSCGLEGPPIGIQRRDLEQALVQNSGSPQEIWRNVQFSDMDTRALRDRFNGFDVHMWKIVLDNQMSLSEEDSGLLYRTALLLEETRKLSEHFWAGGSVRLNIADNLHHLRDYRPRAILPVRSDVDEFADRTFALDRGFIGWMTTIKPDLHVSLTGGMLEEMYGGFGGEVLYRPFGKTFVIGLEAYQVFKRDPGVDLNLGFNGDHLLTGHVNFWYEFPDSDLTLQARVGRYLAEDTGGTLSLQKRMDNGGSVEAFVTATNAADFDIFGSTTHLYSGLKFRLPLGQVKYIPEGSEVRVSAAPLGRDTGQALDAPLKLYEISEPLSYRHIARHWTKVVD